MTYTATDIQILDDAIGFIRRQREMFVGRGRTIAPQLAASIVADAFWLGAQAARTDRLGEWWVVEADRDWLLGENGTVLMAPFHRIVPFPHAGVNCHRNEVLLTAFAEALVTCGSGVETWIVSDPVASPLPRPFAERLAQLAGGRIVAFRLDEPTA